MAEEKGDKSPGRVDKYFDRLSSWLSDRIAAFVAFLFLLFAAGAFYGTFVVARLPELALYLLAAPLALAVVAYYNRGLAAIFFIGLVLFFVM